MATFKAIVIEKAETGTKAALADFDEANLMDGDVTVRVEYSTLNYKDGLAVTGKAPVVRRFPMIAGIDFAGTVESSSHAGWKAGDKVILNGWGCGESHLGAYEQRVARQRRLAGAVAGEHERARGDGNRHRRLHRDAGGDGARTSWADAGARAGGRSWTGAAGGSGLGRHRDPRQARLRGVRGHPRRPQEADYLKRPRRAAEIVERKELAGPPKALAKERFAGAIDSVGSATLANLLSMVRCRRARWPRPAGWPRVWTCRASVAPASFCAPCCLYGMSTSGHVPTIPETRREAMKRLENGLDRQKLATMTSEIGLEGVFAAAPAILEGRVRGGSWSKSGKFLSGIYRRGLRGNHGRFESDLPGWGVCSVALVGVQVHVAWNSALSWRCPVGCSGPWQVRCRPTRLALARIYRQDVFLQLLRRHAAGRAGGFIPTAPWPALEFNSQVAMVRCVTLGAARRYALRVKKGEADLRVRLRGFAGSSRWLQSPSASSTAASFLQRLVDFRSRFCVMRVYARHNARIKLTHSSNNSQPLPLRPSLTANNN